MRTVLRLAGALVFVTGLCILAARPLYRDQLLTFVDEKVLATDRHGVPERAQRHFDQIVTVVGVATALLGLALAACGFSRVRRHVVNAMLSDRFRPVGSMAAKPAVMFLVSSTGAILISVPFVFRTPLSLTGQYETSDGYFSEGLIPSLSAVAFLSAAVLQGAAA